MNAYNSKFLDAAKCFKRAGQDNLAMTMFTDLRMFDQAKEYLSNEQLKSCLPGIDSIEEGVKVYYKYYKKEDELKFKILAIQFTVLD